MVSNVIDATILGYLEKKKLGFVQNANHPIGTDQKNTELWCGMAWQGLVWCGKVRYGVVRYSELIRKNQTRCRFRFNMIKN